MGGSHQDVGGNAFLEGVWRYIPSGTSHHLQQFCTLGSVTCGSTNIQLLSVNILSCLKQGIICYALSGHLCIRKNC